MPEESLASFPPEFQQGMAARAPTSATSARTRPSTGSSRLARPTSTSCWWRSRPTPRASRRWFSALAHALSELPGVELLWRQDVHSLPDEREPFGFKDGIGQPAIEGSGIVGTNPHEAPLKAGEFVLGYQDETGDLLPVPQPEVLGRNGTFMVVRKLHTRVAAFRQYMRERAASPAERGAAGGQVRRALAQRRAACACAPDDDPELGADPPRNNAFMYGDDDARASSARSARTSGA